jgi:hypothetical protein
VVHESGGLAGCRSPPNQGSAVVMAASTAGPAAAVDASHGAICSCGAAGRDGGADHSGVAMSAGGANGAGDKVCAAVVGTCANGSWAAPSGLPQV